MILKLLQSKQINYPSGSALEYYNDEFLPSVEYVKVGKYSFQNMITNEIHEVKEDMVHRLKVALRPNSPELAYL